jgi:hypothetical protein
MRIAALIILLLEISARNIFISRLETIDLKSQAIKISAY